MDNASLSFIKKVLKEKAKEYKKELKKRENPSIEDILPDISSIMKVDLEKAKKRLQVCILCDKYDKEEFTCKKCGCFVPMKVQFFNEKCPLFKW